MGSASFPHTRQRSASSRVGTVTEVGTSPPVTAAIRARPSAVSSTAHESGQWRAGTPHTSADLFRIQIQGGIVNYYKNGVLLYTSSVAPVYPLSLQAKLTALNASVTNATTTGH